MNPETAGQAGVNHALIIAAGRGSRFKSGTERCPKPLLEVNGTPLILHVIRSACETGISRFTVVTGYLGEVLEDYLSRKTPAGVTVCFVRNPDWEKPNGISVLRAKGHVPPVFALLMADHLFDPRILRELASAPLNEGFCRLAVDFNPAGVPDLEDATKVLAVNGLVLDVGKSIEEYNGIDTGVFLCTDGIFTALELSISRGGKSLSDGIRVLARQGKMEARGVGRLFWRDIDDEAGLFDARSAIKNLFPAG